MIDLTGITPVSDVSIWARPDLKDICCRFASQELYGQFKLELKSLESHGLSVYLELMPLEVNINSRNYDVLQVAERIALSFEGKGLKVERVVSRPSATDRNLQSFILG